MLATACSAPIHIGTPVEIPKAAEWQLALGGGATASSETAALFNAAATQAKLITKQKWQCTDPAGSDCMPAQDMRDVVKGLFAVGIAGALDVHAELSGQVGLGHGWAIGARWGSLGHRVDAFWQPFGRPNRDDKGAGPMLTVFAGYSGASVQAPAVLKDVKDLVQVPDSARHAGHFGFQFGRRLGKFGWWQLGPHVLVAHHTVTMAPSLPLFDDVAERVVQSALPRTDASGWSQHVGGNAAIWIGWRPLWVGIEIAASYLRADVQILGKMEQIRAMQVMPTFHTAVRF